MQLGRVPTDVELAETLGISLEKVDRIRDAQNKSTILSLDEAVNTNAPLRDADDRYLLIKDPSDDADPEKLAFSRIRRDNVDNILSTLTERERGILRLRFGLDDNEQKTLEQVGKVYGVSRERVRQIEEKAMNKLRANKDIEKLSGFWDE